MSKIVAWSQWPDLEVPDGVELRSETTHPLESSDLSDINFYVPKYLAGRRSFEIVNEMPALEYLQVPYAGYEEALEFMREGLILANAAGVHNDSTAELAIGLALASRRGLDFFLREQDRGEWSRIFYPSFSDSKIGIIGYGSIGKTIAKILANFAVDIVTFSRSGSDGSLKVADLNEHLPTFDIVILILPLTNESRHLFDKERLALMKNGSLIINVSRGGIIDTPALLAELESKRIYAALDVTDPEPLPSGHPLWKAPNLILTPHVGGASSAFEPRARRLIENQFARLLRGEELINIVARGKPEN